MVPLCYGIQKEDGWVRTKEAIRKSKKSNASKVAMTLLDARN